MVIYLLSSFGGDYILINETVSMRWHGTNKKHYEELGYKFTGYGDSFDVKVEDLSPTSIVRIDVKCDYCGSIYHPQYINYKNGHKMIHKDACIHCSSKKQHEIMFDELINRQYEKVVQICNELGYTLISKKEDYVNNQSRIRYICPKHGEQSSPFESFVRGKHCKICGYERLFDTNRNDSKFIKEYIEKYNNNILLNPDDYKNATTKNLRIQCECGDIFITSYASYYRSEIKRCHRCANIMSTGERIIEDFLKANNIRYVFQYKFNDCKNINILPFDFYLLDYNLCVEYDGEQHYFNVFSEESFSRTKHNDIIKNNYCESNNINLLRIPYWEKNNIEVLIQNKLHEIGKRNSLVS